MFVLFKTIWIFEMLSLFFAVQRLKGRCDISVTGLYNLSIIFSTPSTLLSCNHCYYIRGTSGAERCEMCTLKIQINIVKITQPHIYFKTVYSTYWIIFILFQFELCLLTLNSNTLLWSFLGYSMVQFFRWIGRYVVVDSRKWC